MKKSLFLIAFLLLAGRGVSQIVDSAAVARQVDSLIQVSKGLTGKREFDKALEVNGVAESLALERFGRESGTYGSACLNHGRVLYFKGDYPEAEKWYFEAKAIWESTFGKMHPDYAMSLNNLAVLYIKMGDYEKAEPLHLEAKTIRKKILGKDHADHISSLNNIIIMYRGMGKYERAKELYLELMDIREKAVGKMHPDYAIILNSLAILYMDMEDYEKAEQFHLEAIAIRKNTLGKEHSDYAKSLINLAVVYSRTKVYEKAEPLYLNAISILGKTKENRDYATGIFGLGRLYKSMGNYEKAERLLLEVKAIRESTKGKENPEYANLLNDIGLLYWEMGDNTKAERIFLESKEIREKISGTEHPDYAQSLNNLANLYAKMKNYKQAEQLFLEAKTIQEKKLGKENPHYANTLNNLASLYSNMGHHTMSLPIFLEAKTIEEKTMGMEHPEYAQLLNNIALMFWDSGGFDAAKPYFFKTGEIEKSLLVRATHHLSERELALYTFKFADGLNQPFSFAQIQPDIAPTCYDNILFQKGFLQNAAARVNNRPFADDVVAQKYLRLKSYNRRLATEYTKPIAERNGVAGLEAQANDLEKELARTVAGYGEALLQVKWEEVQAALKPGEAAIEFVHYRFWNPMQTDSTMYAALVLLPLPAEASAKEGGSNPPQFIPLFEEKQLESLLQGGTEHYESHIKSLYAHAPSSTQKSLYQLLWQPLESALGSTKTIYFSPSGLLHRLSLPAIPVTATATLADRHTLVELGSTRSLVVQSSLATSRGNESVLFGGIQYDMNSTAVIQANAALPTDTLAGLRRTLSFAHTDSTLRGGSWKYLPGSDKEVTDAEKIMQESGLRVHTLRGYTATEEAFKNIGSNPSDVASPRILHLATHGFFFPDPKSEKAKIEGADPVFKWSDNPLIRAGLILAGGNHAWKTGQPLRPGMDDGILTAYEISQMNLSNTELVVLSACETGLGDIQGNEGVYGLQRAFKIAGAKYVIMSLWQVPDKQTARLMTIFYKKWLGEKKPVPEAFRAAQQELRGRGFDPFYWAGFVLVE